MYSMTPGHHDNYVLQIMQQAHASLYACRDLSGRGLDGWIRLQQAAADDNEQEQAEKRKMPTEDEQVELAPILLPDQAAELLVLCPALYKPT